MKKSRGKPRQFETPARLQVVMEEATKKEFVLYCYTNGVTPCDLMRKMIMEKLEKE